MTLRFRKFRGGAMWADTKEAHSLQEAAEVYVVLRGQGFAVIPYDEGGKE